MNEPRRHLPTRGAYGEQSGKSGSRTSYPCSTYHPEHSNQHLSPAPFCRSSAQCAHFSLRPCLVGCGVPGTTGHALVLHTFPRTPSCPRLHRHSSVLPPMQCGCLWRAPKGRRRETPDELHLPLHQAHLLPQKEGAVGISNSLLCQFFLHFVFLL